METKYLRVVAGRPLTVAEQNVRLRDARSLNVIVAQRAEDADDMYGEVLGAIAAGILMMFLIGLLFVAGAMVS